MNILPHCILVALLWASAVTAPNGKKPPGTGLMATPVGHAPSSATGDCLPASNLLDLPGHSDILSLVSKHLSDKTLVDWQRTCKTAYADASKHVRMALAQQLALSLLNPKIDKVVAALTKIRDAFKGDPSKYGTEPLHLPSCFNPAYTPKQRTLCLENLWLTTQGQHSILLPDWVMPSLKDLAHALAMGYSMDNHVYTNWHIDFVLKQRESLLTEIQPDDEWSADAYKWLIMALEHIQHHYRSRIVNRFAIQQTSVAEPLQHAISAFICRLVADEIKPYVKGQRVTGGFTTFESVISRVISHVFNELNLRTIQISGFLQSSLLYPGYRFNPLESMRKSGRHHPSLRDIVTGLISVFDPPISTADKNNLVKKWLIDSVIPQSDVVHDKKRVSDRQLVKRFSYYLMAAPHLKTLMETVVISALLGSGPSQDLSSRIGPISAQQVDEILEWEWKYAALKCLAALGRAEVSSELVRILDKKRHIPGWVDRARLRKEMKAPTTSPWKVFVSKLKSWLGQRKPGKKKQSDAGAKSVIVE